MLITRLNLSAVLNKVLQTVKNSDFIALDLEMSGIVSDKYLDPSIADSVLIEAHRCKTAISKQNKKSTLLYLYS